MALAKDPRMGLAQSAILSTQSSHESAAEMEKNGGFPKNARFLFCSSIYKPEISQPVKNFKVQIDRNLTHLSMESSSLLSFGQTHQFSQEDYFNWSAEEDSFNNGGQLSQMISRPNFPLLDEINCSFAPMAMASKESQNGSDGSSNYWLYSEESEAVGEEESKAALELTPHKRPHLGDSEQTMKKQCNSSTKKTKPKTNPAKDPQSLAAKNRRERISERLKILQELVPNGSRADLVTMLEKAISYVKFLQLQVKILATDEFWPVQGRKAPDISQVRDAIDAILSSQRERSSSSNSTK